MYGTFACVIFEVNFLDCQDHIFLRGLNLWECGEVGEGIR